MDVTERPRRRVRAPVDDPELRWLFCEAEGALGLRSSFGALVDLALAGVPQGGASVPRGLTDRRLVAAGEERALRCRLGALSGRDREVLYLAYGPQPWPREVRGRAYGSWPGVLLVVPAARRAHERLGGPGLGVGEWLRSLVARGEAAFLAQLREEARGLVGRAYGAFAATDPAYTFMRATARRRELGRVDVEELEPEAFAV